MKKKKLLLSLPMPRKAPLRSEKQQQQTKSISMIRHHSRDELESVVAADAGLPTSNSDTQRLNRQVTRLKEDIYNSTRREQRLREKLANKSEAEMTLAFAHQESEITSQETKAHHTNELHRLNERIQRLHKAVKRLRAYVGGDARRIE